MPDPKPKLSERVRELARWHTERCHKAWRPLTGEFHEMTVGMLEEAADFIAARETEDDRG